VVGGVEVTEPNKRRWFERFTTLVIIVNTVALTLQDYSVRVTGVDEYPRRTEVLATIDTVVVCIFIVEFVLKVMAMGFIMERHTYMRSWWNLLDFTVVVTR
jgi:hypothetical protein